VYVYVQIHTYIQTKHIHTSYANRPRLTTLLAHWARQANPDFTYTSVQVNKNTECGVHVDKNNLGPSLFVAIGDFKSSDAGAAEHDEERGHGETSVHGKRCGAASDHAGQLWVDGQGPVDARNKWLIFNGNHGRWGSHTCPWYFGGSLASDEPVHPRLCTAFVRYGSLASDTSVVVALMCRGVLPFHVCF
jgi:hypothetical protein